MTSPAPVFVREACKHDTLYHMICVKCQTVLTPEQIGPNQKHVETHMGKWDLIWDLDHTLVHSVPDDIMKAECSPEALQWCRSNPDVYVIENATVWTKLRPGVRQVLELLSQMFRMHVYTMGTRAYANTIVSILDPDGTLFAGRVVSRCDTPFHPDVKKLQYTSADPIKTLIVDDTSAVWPDAHERLLEVHRYTFFPMAPKELSMCSLKLDEDCQDSILSHICTTLQAVHTCKLRGYLTPTLALQKLRHEVFLNYTVCFSRSVVNEEAMRLAAAMGAKTHYGLRDKMALFVSDDTHGTDCAVARRMQVPVVPTRFFRECFLHCRRLKL